MASARRRSIPSVLHNVLDTLRSRYSDFGGYWIFGLLSRPSRATIDLLADTSTPIGSPSWGAFAAIAHARFADQARKNAVARFVRRAALTIARGRARSESVNGHLRAGCDMTLTIEVVSDLGRTYRHEVSFFVAPHDPSAEFRSTRRGLESLSHGSEPRRRT